MVNIIASTFSSQIVLILRMIILLQLEMPHCQQLDTPKYVFVPKIMTPFKTCSSSLMWHP
jgi:hypothetical protein